MSSIKVMMNAQYVKTNLIHYNLWSIVTTHSIGEHTLVSGKPPKKLNIHDDDEQIEWIVPIEYNHDITVKQINSWFESIEELSTVRPKRVTVGVINDDGTVVYYFIHDGVVKPRQN